MNVYKPRWTCQVCQRKISQNVSPDNGICDRCKNKSNPKLHLLNKVPDQYFEFEKIKVGGIKLEENTNA
jgi:thymidine kinase